MIQTILIDDEMHCLDTLSILLEDYCPDIKISGRCTNALDGLATIEKIKPELVFLDIEMPEMNGFEMLEHFKEIPFRVIFATSYDQYAIRAIRFSALDYLLKPVDPRELVAAVQKAKELKHNPFPEQYNMLFNQFRPGGTFFSRFAIPTADGYDLIPAEEVIHLEADDNYTHLYLKNQKKVTACRTLKEMEWQLQRYGNFIRVHHSHMVNLNEVLRYVRGEGGYLIMSNGHSVNVSRSRKESLTRHF